MVARPAYITLFLASIISLKATTQHLQGVAAGNYAGTNSLYHNPAFVADSRYSVHANLAGLNYYVGNNHIKWNAPYSFASLISNSVSDEHRNDRGKIMLPRRYLEQNLNGRNKYLNTGIDLRLPAIMFSLKNGRYGVGLGSRARAIGNMSQITEPLAQLIRGTPLDTALHDRVFNNQQGKLMMNAFAEYSATFGGVLIDNETDFIKVGITVKRLIGMSQNRLEVKRADYQLIPDPEWSNQRFMISVAEMDGATHYTSDQGLRSASLSPDWWLTGKAAPGSGWGIDIGAVYEYRPDIRQFHNFGSANGTPLRDPSKNKYLYRVAVSLTDVGFLNFHNTHYNYSQTAEMARGNLNYNSFSPWRGIDSFYRSLETTVGVSAATPAKRRMLLPMAFQASVDYHYHDNIYINALLVAPLTRLRSSNMHNETVLAITPRYERRWLEISLPISLMNRYRSPGIGLAGRAGPLWLGTDHLPGLFNIGKPKALSFYAGLSMGLQRKPITDEIPCWPPKRSFLKRIFSSD